MEGACGRVAFSGSLRWAGPLFLLGVSAFLGCGREAPSGPPRPSARTKPNLLLVTLDTTRADHLGCYGARSAGTPNLDRVARDGVLVERALAVAPITLPSHASILTALYPPRHGVRDNGDFRIPDSVTTLAEHLKAQEYRTAAIVGSYMLSSVFGVAQGFDVFDEPRQGQATVPAGAAVRFREILERRASEVTDAAISALSRLGEGPFFLWVHYYDPHADYRPPPPFAERFEGSPYDGEIAYMDAEFGRLLGELERRDLLEKTLVVVVGDHGESLGEHGERTHGLLVYESTLRVPLLLRGPGLVPKGRRLPIAVSVADIAPTVLDLVGLPGLPGAQGRSFAEAVRAGAGGPARPIYSESLLPELAYGWARLLAVERQGLKFIEAPEPELYDLAEDPSESRNLAPERPQEVATFRALLEELVAGFGRAEPSSSFGLDEEQRARLRSLGYVSSPPSARAGSERHDPKRFVEVHNDILEVQNRIEAGDLDRAASLLARVLEKDPGNPSGLHLDGTLQFARGRLEHGLSQLARAAELAPGSNRILRNLANALHLRGRLEEAAKAYRAAIALLPADPEGHYGLANVLFQGKDYARAISEYREAIRLGLDVPAVRAALGVALAGAGDPKAAEQELLEAVTRDGRLAGAWNQLGILREKAGRLEEARDSYRRALEADPGHLDALFNYAKVSLRAGDLEAASEGVRKLLARRPDHPVGSYLEAEVRLRSGDAEGARQSLRRFLAQKNRDPRLVDPARKMLASLGG